MWQDALLTAILEIDREQAPHGLYGMRHALSGSDRPIPFAKLLGGNMLSPNVPERLGFKPETARWDSFSFSISDEDRVLITVDTVATIKIRKFGPTYRIDRHHGKHPAKREDEPYVSEKMLSRLGRSALDIGCYLLIAHARDKDEFAILLGEADRPRFCERHKLSYHCREWLDRYNRGFYSGLFLWSQCEPPKIDERHSERL